MFGYCCHGLVYHNKMYIQKNFPPFFEITESELNFQCDKFAYTSCTHTKTKPTNKKQNKNQLIRFLGYFSKSNNWHQHKQYLNYPAHTTVQSISCSVKWHLEEANTQKGCFYSIINPKKKLHFLIYLNISDETIHIHALSKVQNTT